MPKTSNHSLIELCKGRWREFQREPSAFFFVIFMPILWMAILGFAFGNKGAETYGVGWPKGDPGEVYRQALEKSDRVRFYQGTEDELATALKGGNIQIIAGTDGTAIKFRFDPHNPTSAHARDFVNGLFQQAAGRTDPLAAEDEVLTIPGTRYIDFLVPGLLALSIMTSSLFGTGMLIVSSRRENLLKRYRATPMLPSYYIASHIIGRCFILLVEFVTILAAAFLMFRFQSASSVFTLLAFALLGAAAFTALAMLCGSRTLSPATMNGVTNLISLPMMMMSGVWFSRSNFPDWMATPARFLPLTPLVDGFRKIALEGAGFAAVGQESLILLVYLVVAATLAKVTFRWY